MTSLPDCYGNVLLLSHKLPIVGFLTVSMSHSCFSRDVIVLLMVKAGSTEYVILSGLRRLV